MAASPRLDLPGSSLEAEFGGTGGGVRESPIAAAVGASASAPPKATAAPTGTTKYTYTGLCDALNAYEQSLVKAGTVEYANQYAIEFAPASLASSGIVLPGTSDKKLAPGQQTNTAKDKVLPETNTFNSKGKNIAVSQGTQIIQFIELTMRNSRYITDQLLVTQDQVTGNSIPSTSITTNKTTAWFKITVNAVPISPKIDKDRNDYAYKITYSISTYALNEAQSQYFPEAQFRGIHKMYNYWFTGQNTQILSYEQSYNNQYINVLSSKTQTQGKQSIDNALSNSVGYGIGLPKNVPSPRSGQSDQQAENGANNPASTLADYLYSFSDQSEITLQIVGDPAWLVQAEPKGITAKAFEFGGFYSDGTVNPEVQQIVFAVNWNAPSDYNNGSSGPYSGTGLMEVNASNTQGNNNNLANSPMQASAAYTATQVRSTFSKGKFTQELKGNALKNLNPIQLASVARRSTESSNTTQVTANQPQSNTRIPSLVTANNGFKNLTNQLNPNLWNSEPNNTPVSSPNLSQLVEAPPVQPATPAEAPTSNGGINDFAGLDGTSGFTPPQNVATAVRVFGDTGSTIATPSTTSQALQSGQTVVFAESETRITTDTQSMAAKDA
jgi:hypothetical protein